MPPSRNGSRLSGARRNSGDNMNIAQERTTQPSLDLFSELALLTEKYCGVNNVHLRRSGGHRGLDFITFAEHFRDILHPSAVKDWVNLTDGKKRTMLHYAASKGDLTIVKCLIHQGAEKNKIDQYKFNAYGLAMREEHFGVAMYLLTMPSFTYFDSYKGAGTFGSLLHMAVAKMQSD